MLPLLLDPLDWTDSVVAVLPHYLLSHDFAISLSSAGCNVHSIQVPVDNRTGVRAGAVTIVSVLFCAFLGANCSDQLRGKPLLPQLFSLCFLNPFQGLQCCWLHFLTTLLFQSRYFNLALQDPIDIRYRSLSQTEGPIFASNINRFTRRRSDWARLFCVVLPRS